MLRAWKTFKRSAATIPITSGLREVLTLFGGAIESKPEPKLSHTPLLKAGGLSGTIGGEKVELILRGQSDVVTESQGLRPGLASPMAIEGERAERTKADSESDQSATDAEGEASTPQADPAIKVVYVADTDLMLPVFLQIRADPNQAADFRFQFQNVTFLLNTIDWLAGETDFIDVRKHEPIFATLRMIDAVKEDASTAVRRRSKEFQNAYDEQIRDAQEEMDQALKSLREELEELQKKSADGKIPRDVIRAKTIEFQTKQEGLQRALDVKRAKSERDRERSVREIQREANQEVTAIQNRVKAAAVALPCIPPLIIGVIVFASRRLRERENISKSRLK